MLNYRITIFIVAHFFSIVIIYVLYVLMIYFYYFFAGGSGMPVVMYLFLFFYYFLLYHVFTALSFFLKTFDFLFYDSFLFSCWAVQFWIYPHAQTLFKWTEYHAWRNAIISYGVQHHKIKLGELINSDVIPNRACSLISSRVLMSAKSG